jgi:SAM-dependent methyltransferase
MGVYFFIAAKRMTWDPVWEQLFSTRDWGRYPSEDLIRFVARNFFSSLDRTAVRMLEVGCGPGANLWFLAREGFAVYGMDGSATATAIARRRLDTECPGWKTVSGGSAVITGDIAQLPWPDAHFHAAIDAEAVYCNDFDESRRIYSEMYRVTRPGGKLFVRTFACGTWGEGTGRQEGDRRFSVAVGPLAGKGPSRFTSLDEIPTLLAPWRVREINLITRTLEYQRQSIREWVVEADRE